MRVIAGSLKGRRLVVPRGATTRPTGDQVRIALMDTLTPWLPGARVLDLFAGAGGVGFEALSRGALDATFVEHEARAVAALDANIAALGVRTQARVLRLDAGRALRRLAADGERFGIVFLDPPYATDLATRTLEALGAGAGRGPGANVSSPCLTQPPAAAVAWALKTFGGRRFRGST